MGSHGAAGPGGAGTTVISWQGDPPPTGQGARDAGEGYGPEAADQLRAPGGDGRADEGGDGAVPARGHAPAGELSRARARAGVLLGVRPILAGDLPRGSE